MRFLPLLALLALTGCRAIFGGVTPEDAQANAEDVHYFTDGVPAEDAYRATTARERAVKIVNDAAAQQARFSAIENIANKATGFPWADVLGLAGTVAARYGVYHSQRTRRELRAPAAGVKRSRDRGTSQAPAKPA